MDRCLFVIGEYGPVLILSLLFVGALVFKNNIYWIVFLAVLLEWTIIGTLWKCLFLPWESVRPKYTGAQCSLQTTGMPSAHTSCVVLAIILTLLMGSKHHWMYVVLGASVCLLPCVIWQRIAFGYHDRLQIAVGFVTALVSAFAWGIVASTYTSNPQGNTIKC
jgi:hypothetical protein